MKPAVLYSMSFLLAVTVSVVAQTPAPIHKPGKDVSAPVAISQRPPNYPSDALGVDGLVVLECVVETDGSVGDIHVVKSPDPALDEAAIAALKQWRFKPALKDGTAVRALVDVEMAFTREENNPRVDSQDVFKPGPGVTPPTVLKEVKPEYPNSAKGAGLQGVVRIDCVVQPNGRVGDTRITERLDPVLDREAVRALKQWRFRPGQRQGKAVPVQVSVEIYFTLK